MKNIFLIILTLAANQLLAQQWDGSTTTANLIYRTGAVGIGTSINTAKLNVEGSGDWHLRLKDYSGGNDWFIGSSGTAWASGATKLVFSPTSGSNTSVLTLLTTGKVGLGYGNVNPRGMVDVVATGSNVLATIFGRATEGNATGDGTYLGTRTHDTSTANAKSFSIEHSFYGNINSSLNFHRGSSTTGGFITFNTNTDTEAMRILPTGSVCIGGSTSNGYKLAVNGVIGAREVNVNTSTWADYVFDADYKLLPLTDVEKYIASHHHLPEVPTTAEVEANGVNVGEMNALLLKKIEELTLYIIDQEKRIQQLEGQKK